MNQKIWHIGINNQQQGPFSLEELLQRGLTADTLVWKKGMAAWAKAKDVPELADEFKPKILPIPLVVPPPLPVIEPPTASLPPPLPLQTQPPPPMPPPLSQMELQPIQQSPPPQIELPSLPPAGIPESIFSSFGSKLVAAILLPVVAIVVPSVIYLQQSSSSKYEQGGRQSSFAESGNGRATDNVASGTFVDERDGQRYRYVKIGSQTWMAQNLNYVIKQSWCYDNDPNNCRKYGRLYHWNSAMKACPAGWRLPSENDWAALLRYVGGSNSAEKLRSKNWFGTDDYGFSALPGGNGFPEESYNDVNYLFANNIGDYGECIWWSSTGGVSEVSSLPNSEVAVSVELSGAMDEVYIWRGHPKIFANSVRCIKN